MNSCFVNKRIVPPRFKAAARNARVVMTKYFQGLGISRGRDEYVSEAGYVPVRRNEVLVQYLIQMIVKYSGDRVE